MLKNNAKQLFSLFWLFGLINNVLYVVILSAAIDLVGTLIPKATVLLADIVPAFALKVSAPFYIHAIPYNVRISLLVLFSFTGMVIIALGSRIELTIAGIVLASLSSGLGEITFLQLTHHYGSISLNGFSSGTGGAGLVGSFMFLVLTVWCDVSVKTTLLLFAVLPFMFPVGYFLVLSNPSDPTLYEEIEDHQDLTSHIKITTEKLKSLFLPFMVPLSTVYIAEYMINQGISPTLLFPLDHMPFKHFRDAYVTYGTLYQFGVFISRSSGSFFQIDNLYLPSVLQATNLVICLVQSLTSFIPSVYMLMVLMFYEGLLGGLSYVNTFMQVSRRVPLTEREFAMGAVGVSDSAGIVIAGLISLWLEPRLCAYQVGTGRPWCEMD